MRRFIPRCPVLARPGAPSGALSGNLGFPLDDPTGPVRQRPPPLVHRKRTFAVYHARIEATAEFDRCQVEVSRVAGPLVHPHEQQRGTRRAAHEARRGCATAGMLLRHPVRRDLRRAPPRVAQRRFADGVAQVQQAEREPGHTAGQARPEPLPPLGEAGLGHLERLLGAPEMAKHARHADKAVIEAELDAGRGRHGPGDQPVLMLGEPAAASDRQGVKDAGGTMRDAEGFAFELPDIPGKTAGAGTASSMA